MAFFFLVRSFFPFFFKMGNGNVLQMHHEKWDNWQQHARIFRFESITQEKCMKHMLPKNGYDTACAMLAAVEIMDKCVFEK